MLAWELGCWSWAGTGAGARHWGPGNEGRLALSGRRGDGARRDARCVATGVCRVAVAGRGRTGWRLGETVAMSYVRLKPWLDRWSGNESPVRGEMHGARQLSVQGAKVLVFERAIASTYGIWTSVLVRVRQALDPNVGATTLWHCVGREATRKRRESRDSIMRWTVVRSSARPALQYATCHADRPAMTLTGLE